MKPTDIAVPDYFHKVVDCQWACPAHTPVPEYIRLIAAGRFDDAYMINWMSNVFPGILGRTCDRPCEPACRRGRVEERNLQTAEPVAICRLKRVAADSKGDITEHLPAAPSQTNGKRVACIGAGPASLTVARDLAPLGYEVTVFDQDPRAGGMIRRDNRYGTWGEDAFRRDFTINALAFDPATGEVLDPVKGQADLEARRLNTIKPPLESFTEDPVRMAWAMRLAVESGWLAAHAGRIQRKLYATASSPLTGLID